MSRKRAQAAATPHRDAVSQAGPMAPTPGDAADELGSLARELAHSYAALVEGVQRSWGLAPAAAAEHAQLPREQALAMLEAADPATVGWWMMARAMEHDPELALAAWDRVKDAARRELRSGHRVAQALDASHYPWERARFLAVRDGFREEWRPRGGVESALVDQLAESFTGYLRWHERLSFSVEHACRAEDRSRPADASWLPPRIGEARWMAWCANQAEAAHRRFLTTLKSLQDLRRLPGVSIASAGQVNIAQQQINVAADEDNAGQDR